MEAPMVSGIAPGFCKTLAKEPESGDTPSARLVYPSNPAPLLNANQSYEVIPNNPVARPL